MIRSESNKPRVEPLRIKLNDINKYIRLLFLAAFVAKTYATAKDKKSDKYIVLGKIPEGLI